MLAKKLDAHNEDKKSPTKPHDRKTASQKKKRIPETHPSQDKGKMRFSKPRKSDYPIPIACTSDISRLLDSESLEYSFFIDKTDQYWHFYYAIFVDSLDFLTARKIKIDDSLDKIPPRLLPAIATEDVIESFNPFNFDE